MLNPLGAEYLLVDPGGASSNDYRYRLIEMEAKGSTQEHGPFDLHMP